MKLHNFLTFDIGVEAGTTTLATITGNKITLKELTRFPNRPFLISTRNYWDIYALANSVEDGLKAASKEGVKIDGIGIDSWGIDFIFVAYDRTFLNIPRSHRDRHTEDMPELFFQIIPEKELYEMTGVQSQHFNTLFQLYACKMEYSSGLEESRCFLFIPDSLSYLLTNKMACEYTLASTTQLMDPWRRAINPELMATLELSPSLFLELLPPGTIIADLQESAQRESNLWGKIPVIAVAGHNTASAVVAVPAEDEHVAYLHANLGEWTSLGIEVETPIINEDSFRLGFTNEGGAEGTIRFQKNFSGLRLLERCIKEWEHNNIQYAPSQLIELAGSAEPFRSFINLGDACFANPDSITEAINDYCASTNQPLPSNHGEYIRCIFESIALKCRYELDNLKQLAPFEIHKLHVIGYGSDNDLLTRFIANAVAMTVEAGPVAAATLGNAMMQAKATGVVSSLKQMREIIRNSFPPTAYHPQDREQWEEHYARFLTTTGLSRR